MRRFFTALIFAISLLCSHTSYAQEKPQPTADSAFAVVADNGSQEAQPAPEIQQNKNEKKNSDTVSPANVSTQKVAIDNRAANIAEEANDWAMWQTIIGGIGLLFVIAATVFAGLAWRAAKDGADIGRDTLDETIAANKRAQRAFVGIATFNYHFLPMDDGQVSFNATSGIKNFGQTPAFNQKNSTRIVVVDAGSEESIGTASMDNPGITLFPNTNPTLSVGLIISAENANAIRNETKKVFVMVYITYEDIFGDKHWSKTQYTLSVRGLRSRFSTDHGGALTYYSEENSHKNTSVTLT